MTNRTIYRILILMTLTFLSCSEATIGDVFNEDSQIRLKWFPSYSDDSFEKNKIALDWCLSYLGGNTTSSSVEINSNNNIIILDIDQFGFSEKAITELRKLHRIFKNSEEYTVHGAFDIGKYIAMTLGSSNHYYKIVDVPDHIDYYTTNFIFNELKGYIDQSSISLPSSHRIISYSPLSNNEQVFVSEETDPTTQEVKEFETLERMPNGQLKFAVYDANGFLIPNADNTITEAGKPAKCIWCHEVNIQSLFTQQNNFTGFLSFTQLTDTLNFYNFQLKTFQDNSWINPNVQNKTLHTNMELSYITYMEPSAERLALEWNMSVTEVQNRLQSIPTHTHEEFVFLGVLYNRKDVSIYSPYEIVTPPGSIREASSYEPDLLN